MGDRRAKKIMQKDMLIIDKKVKNKEALQETQLVKIEAKETLKDKVDINKIKEVRWALRRRYGSRTNFRKIFKDWDQKGVGEISLYDAHSMINRLGIPINFNETLALISSSNNRNSNDLNMEEFMHLIFSDNPGLNVDLEKIQYKDENQYMEEEQMENFQKELKNNIGLKAKDDDVKHLKEFLRIRIPTMATKFNEFKDNCNLNNFMKVMHEFNLPIRFEDENLLKHVYNQFKTENDVFDYKNFIEHVADMKEVNDFFNFKDRFVNSLKEKIDKNTKTLTESVDAIAKNEEIKRKRMHDLEEQERRKEAIRLCMQREDEKIAKEINNSQPSKEYFHKIFKNKDEMFQKHNELQKNFSAHPSLMKNLLPKTRFGGNPNHQNTFINFQAPKEAGMYISEKDRFDIRCKEDYDFSLKHKADRARSLKSKMHIIQTQNKRIKEHHQFKDYIEEEKNIYSLLHRTQKMYKYEKLNRLRNEIVE